MNRGTLWRGFVAGAIAGLALLAAMYAADLAIGLHPLPQLLQEPLLAVMPGPVFGFLIDTLKHAGKVIEEAGLIVMLLGGLGALGCLYAVALHRRPIPHLAMACAALGWGVVTLILLPISGDGLLGLGEGIQAPLLWAVLFLVYSVALQACYREPGPDPVIAADPGRRRVLRTAPLIIGGVSLVILAGRLVPRWYQSVILAPEAAITGQVPELTPVADFYVVSKNFQDPVIDPAGWSLRVHGGVNAPATLTYEALQALPQRTEVVTLECISNTVGGPQISTGSFSGVSLRDVIAAVQPHADASHLNFSAGDGFSETMPLAMAMEHPEILVALQLDGRPLSSAHGFPARILIPGHYGMKGPKWLQEIEVATSEKGGYWEGQGWDRQAIVKTMSRIDSPADGAVVKLGAVKATGIAFAGLRGVSKVEVSTDGGGSWAPARLRPPLSPYSWTLWDLDWKPTREGAFGLRVRATDGGGAVQDSGIAASYPSGSSGYHSITVNIARA